MVELGLVYTVLWDPKLGACLTFHAHFIPAQFHGFSGVHSDLYKYHWQDPCVQVSEWPCPGLPCAEMGEYPGIMHI